MRARQMNGCSCQQSPVSHPKLRPRNLPAQDRELVPQHQQLYVFHIQATAATNERAQQSPNGEVKEGKGHVADPLRPLAVTRRHRYGAALQANAAAVVGASDATGTFCDARSSARKQGGSPVRTYLAYLRSRTIFARSPSCFGRARATPPELASLPLRNAARREPVAGVGAVDQSTNQSAAAQRERREHVSAPVASHIRRGRGTVVRRTLRKSPDRHLCRPPS
jgi:hypothetical protein